LNFLWKWSFINYPSISLNVDEADAITGTHCPCHNRWPGWVGLCGWLKNSIAAIGHRSR